MLLCFVWVASAIIIVATNSVATTTPWGDTPMTRLCPSKSIFFLLYGCYQGGHASMSSETHHRCYGIKKEDEEPREPIRVQDSLAMYVL